MKPSKRINWRRLAITLVVFVVISLALAYVGQALFAKVKLPSKGFAPLVYLTIFGLAVVVNLSFVPLPFLVSLMITAATKWDPLLVALFGSLGASIGELSGYYVGRIGKRVAIPDDILGYQLMQRWIRRWGVWAIAFLSFQPILPMEIGGFIAGAAEMPIAKFMPALWVGKFPKYIILIYGGTRLFHLLPFFH